MMMSVIEYYERKQEYDNKNVNKRTCQRMDTMTELDKAIQFLREQYERAQRIEYIHNPLAWALYQTWRHVDEPPKEG